MSRTISVIEVVSVLNDSSVLTKNWVEFANRLGLSADTVLRLRRQFKNDNLTVYDLLMEILTTWTRINGTEATLHKLGKTLNTIGENDIADTLLRETNRFLEIVSTKKKEDQSIVSSVLNNRSVVQILCEDPVLIKNWVELADSLELDRGMIFKLKSKCEHDRLTFYELFREILGDWSNRNGLNANLEKFIDVLFKMGARGCAERLQERFELTEIDLREISDPETAFLQQKINVSEVAKILRDDYVLMDKWVELADGLELSSSVVKMLNYNRKHKELPVYELFTEILSSWVDSSGNHATVEKLVLILEQMGAKVSADHLQGMCHPSSEIGLRGSGVSKKSLQRISVVEIVKTLGQDWVFKHDWVQLAYRMRLRHDETEMLNHQYQDGILTGSDLLKYLLIHWVSHNGSEATGGKLCSILVQMRAYKSVDDLKIYDSFESSQIIMRGIKIASQEGSLQFPDEEIIKDINKWEKYKVLGLLGAGSFGFVFKILKDATVEPTALKIVVPQSNLPTNVAVKEILEDSKELQAMKVLDSHENVVKLKNSEVLPASSVPLLHIYGERVALGHLDMYMSEYNLRVETSKRIPSILIEMELCGPSLRQWLVKNDTIAKMRSRAESFAEEQFQIAQCIINGLQYVHGRGLMHRDIKPENIYFSTDEFLPCVKIGDFGLSRIMSGDATDTTTTNKGTPLYQAPEVSYGKYGQQADLFSLGLVLLEVFQVIPSNNNPELRRLFGELTIDRDKSRIQPNPWVPNLEDTIFNLTYRKTGDRTKSINEVTLKFKSQQ